MTALEQRDPRIESHSSSLPFLPNSSFNEQFVARLTAIFPEVALRNRDTFKDLTVFSVAELVERLVQESPFVFLDSNDFTDLLTGELHQRAIKTAAAIDPKRLLNVYKNSLNALGLSDAHREELGAFFVGYLSTRRDLDMSAIAVCNTLGVKASDTKRAAFDLDVERNPAETLDALHEYQLMGQPLEEALTRFISKGLAEKVVSNLTHFDGVPPRRRELLVRALERHRVKDFGLEVLYKEISHVLEWVGPFELKKIDLSLMERYWRDLLMHRSKLGIDSHEVVPQLILRKVEHEPALVMQHLRQLNLTDSELCKKIALALCKKLPAHTPDIIEALKITDQTLRGELECIFAQLASNEADHWLERTRGAPSPGFLRGRLLSKMRSDDPWRVLPSVLKVPESERGELSQVFVLCARRNPTRTLNNLGRWNLSCQSLRLSLFDICAESKPWQALQAAKALGALGSPNLRKTLALAMERNSERAIKLLPKLPGFAPEDARGLICQAIRRNAAASIRVLKGLPLSRPDRVEFVRDAVRRNPQIFNTSADLIKKLVPTASLPSILAAQCRGNVDRAIKLVKLVGWPNITGPDLARACAIENYSVASKPAPEEYQFLVRDLQFLEQAVINAIIAGRWNSAFAIASQIESQGGAQPRDRSSRDTLALQKLTSVVAAAGASKDLDVSERANIGFMKQILKINCIPTDTMQRTLDYFGEDDAAFLLSIAEREGSSVAEGIFEILLDLYTDNTNISAVDRAIINFAISLGFRGLSQSFFTKMRLIFESESMKDPETLQKLMQRELKYPTEVLLNACL
jgi:hypothetical protein